VDAPIESPIPDTLDRVRARVAERFPADLEQIRDYLRPLPYPLAPWCAPYFVFDRILGLPWAAGGVGHAAGAHGPDEYATLAGLQEHVVGAAAFLLAYAAGDGGAPA
jgi:acetylornithine deacetylase/succinyl-diaminopimelate desuccinylase-like protein